MSEEPNLDYICDMFKNKKLKKIVNVYQKKYINAIAQGFGDFLRGSIYLTYVCKILNLEFDIDLSRHPMAKFLDFKNYPTILPEKYENIEAFIDCYNHIHYEKIFINNFINKLNSCSEETIYVFVNYKPLFNIENPLYGIISNARNIIIPKIEPNNIVLSDLDNKLSKNGLKRNAYAIIHIRCGDYFMKIKKNVDSEKHQISTKHINDIIKFINLYCNKNKNYILIGDSNYVKNIIKQRFSNIVTFNTAITHLGEDENPDSKAIKETILDFNLMRYSNYILSFTAYGHGSGFANYSAVIYDIPFKQIILNPLLQYNT
jgi:hypothetical protein